MSTPKTYRLTLRGCLSESFVAALPVRLVAAADGQTTVDAAVDDQAGLYGLLNRLRDLNLDLVRLEEAVE